MAKYSIIDGILFIIANIYFLNYCILGFLCLFRCNCLAIFLYTLYIIMLIILNAFSITVIILENKIFTLTGYFPSFLIDDINEMKNPNGKKKFWINLVVLIYQIPIFVLLICINKLEQKREDLLKKTINNTLLINDETKTPSKDFEITPTPKDEE